MVSLQPILDGLSLAYSNSGISTMLNQESGILAQIKHLRKRMAAAGLPMGAAGRSLKRRISAESLQAS
jgi:hypothetical protein